MSKIVVATSSPLGEEAIGKVALYLSEALASEGLLKSLIYAQGHPLEKSSLKALKIHPLRIPFIGRFDWGLKLVQQYREAHYQNKTAGIITPDVGLFYGWMLQSRKPLEKCKQQGVRSALECGSIYPANYRQIVSNELNINNISSSPWHITEKRLTDSLYEISLADLIVVPSQLAEDSFIKQGFKPEKLIVLPPGVDCQFFKPTISLANKKPALLYVGRLELAKGVHHLISAWKKVKGQERKLWLIGNMQPCLRQWLEQNPEMLDERIEFMGIQTDLRPFFEQALFTVLPSLADGFGMAIMEGMAAGLPAIVTDNCGVKMAIDDGENGWIVTVADLEALARKIDTVFSNKELRTHMGENARIRAMDYSWQNFSKKAVELLLSHLNN